MKQSILKNRFFYMIMIILSMIVISHKNLRAETLKNEQIFGKGVDTILIQAVMCSAIKKYLPVNPSIVFSNTIGSVFCYSVFDPVPQKTFICHKWYYEDKLVRQIKLLLHPPKWTAYSTIQLRDEDKGPWRVEISDYKGKTFKVLRFSITE